MAAEPVAWTQFHPFILLPFFGPHVPKDLEMSVKDFGIAFSSTVLTYGRISKPGPWSLQAFLEAEKKFCSGQKG